MPCLLFRAIGPLVGAETCFGTSEGYYLMFMLIVALERFESGPTGCIWML